MAPDWLSFINLFLAGTLFGMELATTIAVSPAARKLPTPAQVTLYKGLAGRYKVVGPLVIFSTFATGVAVSIATDSPGRVFAIAGTFSLAAMIAITFAGNLPINIWTLKASPDVDPADWAARRCRWDSFHEARVALDGAALACFIVALLRVA